MRIVGNYGNGNQKLKREGKSSSFADTLLTSARSARLAAAA